jgi:uncharacterized protein (DUF58 family)
MTPVPAYLPAAWRHRIGAWWQSRIPLTDTLTLTQGNIYIVPTRAGLMFLLTVALLLVASINYQLGLGYLLTFLLAGAGFMSMLITHGTLRGLKLHLRSPAPVFAGEPAALEAVLTAPARGFAGRPGRARWGIGLSVDDSDAGWAWVDVPAGAQATATISFVPTGRGLHPVPTLRLQTPFPLGLFRAWTVWRPAAKVLAYPRPETPCAPLPVSRSARGDPTGTRRVGGDETEGVRNWQRGDPLNQIVWKKSVRALETGGDLVSRDTSVAAHRELWLDDQQAGLSGIEQRLSRLAAWAIAAERAGADYGLRLGGREWPPAHGAPHQRQVLEALALWS